MSDSSSDSEDFDYIPGNESASEASAGSESEGAKQSSGSEAEPTEGKSRKPGKRKRRKRAKGTAQSEAVTNGDDVQADTKASFDKQRADELWASFMAPSKAVADDKRKPISATPTSSSTVEKTVTKPAPATNGNHESLTTTTNSSLAPAASASASAIAASSGSNVPRLPVATPTASANNDDVASNAAGKRKAGIDGVLAFINKKQKLNTVEKSKLDWETFKREADLKEELATFNRGKTGYLEKQAFLERTDLRVYEHERDIRMKQINKRLGERGSKAN